MVCTLYEIRLVEDRLGYEFTDKSLLAQAFIHRSFVNEQRGSVESTNERLEFLGDAVLTTIIAGYLYLRFPKHTEGELTACRARLVDSAACAKFMTILGVDFCLKLGKGVSQDSERGRNTILADLFEAVLGAIYLDGGLESCKRVFFLHFQEELDFLLKDPMSNWKAQLQHYTNKKYHMCPSYRVLDESGPAHQKEFLVGAFIGEEKIGEGTGPSKKEAEQNAAKHALGNTAIMLG